MTGPLNLSRPLAARIVGLPQPPEFSPGPPVSQAVIDAACEALAAGKTHYTDRPGILPLRAGITQYLKARFEVEYAPDDVTITCGATEARFVAVKQLASAGTQMVCPSTAGWYAGAAHLAGVTLVAGADDPAAISLIALTPEDAPETRDRLLAQAVTRGWWVIWDVSSGAGSGFHPAHDPALRPHVVTIGSLSRHMPGWRVGWMAGSEWAGKLRAYKQSITICSASVSQWAALGLAGDL